MSIKRTRKVRLESEKMSLSVGLQLQGIDDYIAPSQVCVMPLTEDKAPQKKQSKIMIEGTTPQENTTQLTRVTVRLEDCLACSGCITSAESILIEEQGFKQFKNTLKTLPTTRRIVCSYADEVIASLSAYHNQPFWMVVARLEKAMKREGVSEVVDLTDAMDVSLLSMYEEYKQHQKEKKVYLTTTCPGWLCYAEKMQGDTIFPYLGKTASAMTIKGILLKATSDVYHVSVQMCYDKKLEATKEINGLKSVDCVLTTNEIDDIINWEEKIEKVGEGIREFGYLNEPGKYIALREGLPDTFTTLRNKDFFENSHVAIVYGFRNIQNVVRMTKTKSKFDFIEVEACPGGCLCGGGQIKCLPKERTERVEKMRSVMRSREVEEKNRIFYNQVKDKVFVTLTNRKPSNDKANLNW
ncbi:hypothetical protein EIN_475610 [Entamoeba invadens IP1]|uniref:Iron hydrogenase large subunit C-terminal domain-containing protein n=1 Tax=Entamoeba invadens IP1 TaxID=370355 RepID=A0A0A1U3R8_ENTIV|nr:hypothetical protein EIN_475610 [Entamoeba invadens IP1]ELP88869.1 hypothetical protein EIN_475610 [Entamoeba invadens IP1]|eukprot:XP_004255640.1 hypothetical protein EIN_475610 [Entamoeba invadens IP1]